MASIDISPTLIFPHPLVLHEKVDERAGMLMRALSRYVPSLKDLLGLDKYMTAAAAGEVPVQYTDNGIGRLQITALEANRKGELQPVTMLTHSNHWN